LERIRGFGKNKGIWKEYGDLDGIRGSGWSNGSG